MNCRLFEAAGCGAAVLTEMRPELPLFFHVGREVLAFTTSDELVDQARMLLEDTARAQSLGDAAALRARDEHTYDVRLQQLLEIVTTCS